MISPKVDSTNCAFKYIPFPHVREFLKSIQSKHLLPTCKASFAISISTLKNWENISLPKVTEEVIYTYFPFPFCFIS